MVYFTDGILIPGDKGTTNQARDLSRALNGTGMIKCAQVKYEPDLVIDWERSGKDEEYMTKVETQLRAIMSERKDEYVETGGAWGGPGGPSEAWGVVKNEPEISYRAFAGEAVIKVINTAGEDYETLKNNLHDWLVEAAPEENDGSTWDVEGVSEKEDVFIVSWKEDPNWQPEGPDYDPDEGWDDDGDYGPPADWDPYGGP